MDTKKVLKLQMRSVVIGTLFLSFLSPLYLNCSSSGSSGSAAAKLNSSKASTTAADLSITSYGATAVAGVDNTQAILNTIAAAQAQGVNVFVPVGTFDHQSFTYSGVKIYGTGATSILRATNPSNARINLTGDGTALANVMVLVTNAASRNGNNDAVRNINASNFYIDHVTIQGPEGTCIVTTASYNGQITNNNCSSSLADGIHTTGASYNMIVANNLVRNTGDDSISVVSYVINNSVTPVVADPSACHDILIQNNDVGYQYTGRGLSVAGGYNITIQNNTVSYDTGSAGIILVQENSGNWTEYPISNVVVQNNNISNIEVCYNLSASPPTAWGGCTVNDGHAGIEISSASTTIQTVLIQNNIVQGTSNDGLRTDENGGGALNTNIIVNNNQFANAGNSTGIDNWAGTGIYCSGNTYAATLGGASAVTPNGGSPQPCDGVGTAPFSVTGSTLSYSTSTPFPTPIYTSKMPQPVSLISGTLAVVLPAGLSSPSVALGGNLNITYNFQSVATSGTSLTLYVHFEDVNGNIVFGDDHIPPTLTTTWSGNVSYTRTIAIPGGIAVGTYDIMVGLYDTGTSTRYPFTVGNSVTQDMTASDSYTIGRFNVH